MNNGYQMLYEDMSGFPYATSDRKVTFYPAWTDEKNWRSTGGADWDDPKKEKEEDFLKEEEFKV